MLLRSSRKCGRDLAERRLGRGKLEAKRDGRLLKLLCGMICSENVFCTIAEVIKNFWEQTQRTFKLIRIPPKQRHSIVTVNVIESIWSGALTISWIHKK